VLEEMSTTTSDPSGAPDAPARPWYRAATRWTQLTFVEDDPLTFDLDAWREVMRESRSNAICISAGGYIAYYPTAIPFHHRSCHLGDRDLLGEVVDTARSLGMRVMARVDPHAVHADAAAAHPEWLARHADGSAVPHPSFPDIWITCPFTTYHREFITDVACELAREYDVDALFVNRWEGPGHLSYSEGARSGFHRATGLELPRRQDRDDPNWAAYAGWRSAYLRDLVDTWNDAVQRIRPAVSVIPNRGMWQTRALDPAELDRTSAAFYIDKQGRSAKEAIWYAGRVGKRIKGVFPDRPINLITSVGPEQHTHRWKDSVDAPDELVTSIVNGFIHGADPWFTKFNARIVDDRWIAPIVRAYQLHAAVEPVYAATTAAPEVCILDSVALDDSDMFALYTATFPHEDGVYQALLEARIPFGYVSDRDLTLERLAGVRVLVLPGTDALTPAQTEVLRRFVARGGSIVAAHAATLRDDGFLLGDLLGVEAVGPVRTGVKNNYIALTGAHRVNAGYRGASRIVGGTSIVPIAAAADTEVPFRFVPDFPDLPMEEVYPRESPRDPAIVCRTHAGGGRTAYVAFDVGEIFWEALQLDHARLIANLVSWAIDDRHQVRVDGEGLVDLAVRRGERSVVVAVANIDNAMSMRGQVHRLRPLGRQAVSVDVPAGVEQVRATRVIAGGELDVRIAEGRAEVVLDAVEHLEVVRFEWSTSGGAGGAAGRA